MRFDINDYHGNYAMCCDTIEEARIFCKYLDDNGKTWCSGDRYINVFNFNNEDGEAYYFNEGMHSTIWYAHNSAAITLKFSDFEWPTYEYERSDITLDEVLGIGEEQ